jgi:hypothetical protein
MTLVSTALRPLFPFLFRRAHPRSSAPARELKLTSLLSTQQWADSLVLAGGAAELRLVSKHARYVSGNLGHEAVVTARAAPASLSSLAIRRRAAPGIIPGLKKRKSKRSKNRH